MTISTNDNDNDAVNTAIDTNGAFADGLTLIRVILTPIIMFIIIKAWSAKPDDPEGFVSLDLNLVLLASILFAVAALTDIADDYVGGSANAQGRLQGRLLGWFDDIADSVLVAGTLLALTWVVHKAGLLHWAFAIPVALLIGRDILVWVVKRYAHLESRIGDIKSALAMLGTCILVASPWLSNIIDGMRANSAGDNVADIFNNASPLVWNFGTAILWVAALLALISGFKILTASTKASTIESE